MGAKRVSKQGVTVSQGNAIEVTDTAGSVLFSVNNAGSVNTLANLTAKGDLLTASAASTPTALAVGTDEQRLVADSATTSGLKYVADTTNYAIAAKGDLLVGTAADTVAALTAGSNGDTLVADSAATTGLRWQGNYAAGKNKILNSDFSIWQRSTSFSSPTSGSYTSDRWVIAYDGTGATRTISQQTFTAGTAPVAGYEGTYFYRWATSVAGTSNTYNVLATRLEDVRLMAGQTVTLSFWAKADATRTVAGTIRQYFGSGGSTQVDTSIIATTNLTTGWVRYTGTVTLPSISGKTIGTGSYLQVMLYLSANTTMTIDVWGLQLEAGSVATAFQTATGNPASELAACQRYYEKSTKSYNGWSGNTNNTSIYYGFNNFSVAKRTTSPTVTATHTFASGFPTTNPIAEAIDEFGFRTYKTADASTNGGYFFYTWIAENEL